jgi:6-phospho-beta-glucosidase
MDCRKMGIGWDDKKEEDGSVLILSVIDYSSRKKLSRMRDGINIDGVIYGIYNVGMH